MPAPTILWIRAGVGFTAAAAASFSRAEASWGRRIDCNSSYRDYYTQLSMYLAWNAYVAGTGPYPGHSRAIHPDYSKHCQGLALDSDDWQTPGFIAHMADHGWIRTAASDPTERHHFEYQSWRDNHRNEPAGSGGTEFEMPLTSDEIQAVAKAVWNYMVQPQDADGNYIAGSVPARGFLANAAANAQAAKTAALGWADAPLRVQDRDGNYVEPPVMHKASGFIANTNAQVQALREVVAALALGQGLDPQQIESAAERGVARSLEAAGLTVSGVAAATADEQDRRARERLAE